MPEHMGSVCGEDWRKHGCSYSDSSVWAKGWMEREWHAPVRTPHGSSLMMIVVPPRTRPALSVASVSVQGAKGGARSYGASGGSGGGDDGGETTGGGAGDGDSGGGGGGGGGGEGDGEKGGGKPQSSWSTSAGVTHSRRAAHHTTPSVPLQPSDASLTSATSLGSCGSDIAKKKSQFSCLIELYNFRQHQQHPQ